MPRPRRLAGRGANKFGAVQTQADGYTFDSKREAARYQELKYLVLAGEIVNGTLLVHRRYSLVVSGILIGHYEADFSYTEKDGSRIVEDVKGVKTQVYRLKAKLMLAIHGITISEVC